LFCLRSLNHVYNAAATLGAELDSAGSESEQSVVLALANVCAWVEVGAALANEDLACVYNLACVALDAEALCV
jgi:hypothetical protein